LIHKFKTDDFFRNNLVFFFGSQLIAFLNYAYYPVLGRLLPLRHFGELQVLLSLFLQFVIFINVLSLVSTNVVNNEKDPEIANRTVSEIEKVALYAGYLILGLAAVASPLLASALKFDSPLPFIVMGVVLIVTVALGFRTAYLRGKSDFMSVTVAGVVGAGAKIIASAAFVLLGLQTVGVTGGILAAQLLALLYAGWRAKRLGFVKKRSGIRPDWKVLRPQASFAGLVLCVSFICTLLFSIDVTLVKYLFSPEVAGLYAGVATTSRIVLFLTASFGVVLLSAVKIKQSPQENSRLLVRSFAITLALGGTATLVFAAFPTQVINLLFGARFDVFAGLLPLLSAAMLFISLATLIGNYHVALRHTWVILYVIGGAVITAALLLMNHASPFEIVRSLAIGSGAMFAGLFVWTGYRAGFRLPKSIN
jgi:O-antigen/teichoic acid export membrane protein